LHTGTLMGSMIRVRLRKAPLAEIPTDREKRIDWLDSQGMMVDERIESPSQGKLPTKVLGK